MTQNRAEALQKALQQLEDWQAQPTTPATRNRRFTRFTARGEARLRPANCIGADRPPINVQVRDISRGGIGVLCTEPIRVGAMSCVQLLASSMSIATFPAACRYSREIVDGVYLIGCEFGAEASILMSLGICADEILMCDEPEFLREGEEFLAPDSLFDQDAA